MPLAATDTIPLTTRRLRELHATLGKILTEEGDLLVMTEVGLNQGRDVFIAGCAINLRLEFGRIVISADERA